MKRETINYFAVGLFVLTMAVLLAGAVFVITGRNSSEVSYYAFYPNIAGIAEGSTVTYNGYQVGRVVAVNLASDGGRKGYMLKFAVRADWHIPADSIAQIVAPGLLSAKQIDIQPGHSPTSLAPDGKLIGQEEVEMMTAISQAAADLSLLANGSLQPMITELSKSVTGISDQLQTELPKLFIQLNKLLSSLNKTADQLAGVVDEDNSRQIKILLENTASLSADLVSLVNDVHDLRDEFANLVGEGQQILVDNRAPLHATVEQMDTASTLLAQHLTTILYHLDTTSRNLNELTRSLRQDPSLLVRGTQPMDEPGGKP